MPANNAKIEVGYLAGRYEGRIGWLMGPGGWHTPRPWLPYALDNGRFAAWSDNKPWDESAYLKMLDKAGNSKQQPLWAVVPDMVGDRDGTLREWERWAPLLEARGFTLAMAVQDGMTPTDVPSEATVIFVGGTTRWKRRTLNDWAKQFPRVHVGKINTIRWLWVCHRAGVESCDGTGWFRGNIRQLNGLFRYLEDSHAGRQEPQGHLFEEDRSRRNPRREVGGPLQPHALESVWPREQRPRQVDVGSRDEGAAQIT